ncbi:hypothetical protein D9M72_620970 [compost metagenome]
MVLIVAPKVCESRCDFIALNTRSKNSDVMRADGHQAMRCWETAMGNVVIAARPIVASRVNTTAPAGSMRADELASPSSLILTAVSEM